MPVRRDAHVARLDIAVQHHRPAGVHIGQRIAQRHPDHDHFLLRQRPQAVHTLAQVFPLDVIHHQVLALIFDHKVVGDARQVGMAQVGQDGGLQAELTRVFLGGEEVLFNCHFYPEVLVNRAIHRRHSPLPQDLDDAVTLVEQ